MRILVLPTGELLHIPESCTRFTLRGEPPCV